MFNMGFGEMILLGVIALIVIGPKQLPEVARTVARLLNEWRRVTSDFTQTFINARDEVEHTVQRTMNELEKGVGENATPQEPLAFDEDANLEDHLQHHEEILKDNESPSSNLTAGNDPKDPKNG